MPTPEQLADEFEPHMRQAFLAMVSTLADGPSASALNAAVEAGDVAAIVRLFEASTAITATPTLLVPAYQRLLQRVGTSTLAALSFPITFDVATPTAEQWIATQSSTMVKAISDDTLSALRTTLGTSYQEGLGSRWTARQIRHLVGLVPSHAQAVARYSNYLQSIDTPPVRVEHFTNAYARRLLNWRADTIAATETMTAAHYGQYEAWRQLFAGGFYLLHESWVEWVVTDDDRLCPLCAPMDGKRVRFGEYFTADVKGFPDGKPDVDTPGSRRRRKGPIKPDPLGQPRDAQGRFMRLEKRDTNTHLDGRAVPLARPIHVLHPPLHPRCRCAMRLRFD